MALQHDGTAARRHGGRSKEAEERDSGDEVQRRSFELGRQRPWRTAAEATGEQEVRASGPWGSGTRKRARGRRDGDRARGGCGDGHGNKRKRWGSGESVVRG